jgi:hypothetical protein
MVTAANAVWRAERLVSRRRAILARLAEMRAPEILVETHAQLVSQAEAQLEAARKGEPDDGASVDVTFAPPPDRSAWASAGADLEIAPSCAFLGERVIVCDGERTRVDGTTREWPSLGLRIYATSAELVLYRHGALTSYHLLDVERGEWLTRARGGFPAAVMHEEKEQAFVVNVTRGRKWHAWEVADYPAVSLCSADGRYLWIMDKEMSGGIYDGETGDLMEARADDDESDSMPLAFARVGDRFRSFPDPRLVRVRGARAVAFDVTGMRLAVLTRKNTIVVERLRAKS